MHRVTKVEVLPDYQLHLTFNDGAEGKVSLADRLFGSMFVSGLRDALVGLLDDMCSGLISPDTSIGGKYIY